MKESKIKKEEKRAQKFSVFLHELKKRKDEGTLAEIWEDWKWILKYTKKYKLAVVFYIVTGILSSTFSLVSAVASKYTIDIITGFQISKLWIVIVIMICSLVLSITMNSVTNRISTKLSIDINNDIQSEIYDQIMDSDWLQLSSFSNGDILNRFNSDVATIASNAINWLPSVVISMYQLVATFCVIWYYSPVMSVIALSSAPVLLVFSRTILKIQKYYYKRVREVSSKLMGFEVESFYNLDTIKSFGIVPMYSQKLKDRLSQFRSINLEYNKYSIITNVLLSLLSSLVEFAAFGYCLWQLWTRQISYGTMTLFLQQRSSLSSAFNKLISIFPVILTASVSARRVQELLELPKESHSNASKNFIMASGGLTVELSNIDYSYQEDLPVIRQSDFIASPGEIVALVGPSGEGKTTVIRLILGLIHPQNGEAVIYGEELNAHPNADLRHLISYVPQGNTIISGTIADNLRLVKEDASDEEIIAALKTACAWDFVQKLKNGIDSPVGERGRGLSEGQAQRVAIARAVLRDAPILLLDEATSALDVTTERMVLRNIVHERPDKTIIVTTHRPSVLNLCQRVYRIIDNNICILSEEESSRMAIDF